MSIDVLLIMEVVHNIALISMDAVAETAMS